MNGSAVRPAFSRLHSTDSRLPRPEMFASTLQTTSESSETPRSIGFTTLGFSGAANTSRSSNNISQASRPVDYLKAFTRNLKKTFAVIMNKKTEITGRENEINWHRQGVEVTKEDFLGLPSISDVLQLYRIASPASLARVSREIDEDYERAYQRSLTRRSEQASSGDA